MNEDIWHQALSLSSTQPQARPDPASAPASLLAEIEALHLATRQIIDGALAGVHRSRRRGASIEFHEHKLYTPGDDIRHIDWRAFGKTDRYHIKQFEDETGIRVVLLVDHSGSMDFASAAHPSKLALARALAAAVGYLALRQGDATGLCTFNEAIIEELPAQSGSGQLMELLSRLVRLRAAGPTRVSAALSRLAQTRRKRSLLVLFSDLFDSHPELPTAFRQLAAAGHDMAVVHLVDPAELDFPYDAPATFVAMEDERRLFVQPRTLRTAYQRAMRQFLDRTAAMLTQAGIQYQLVRTSEAPAAALTTFLRHRERRR